MLTISHALAGNQQALGGILQCYPGFVSEEDLIAYCQVMLYWAY